ncbi:MAG: hypothetical protein GY847_14715 [Proteobacteria bacterium]|nr:hypothetical protein [Pseudomonadota bacterium]
MKRVIALMLGTIFVLLMCNACEQADKFSDAMCGPCGSIDDGSLSISGDARLDGFFKAVASLKGSTGRINAGFQADVFELAQVFMTEAEISAASDFDALVDALSAKITSEIDATVEGDLSVNYTAPKCSADVNVAVEAQASCEAQAGCTAECDPGELSVTCSGKCEGSCEGKCDSPTPPQCSVEVDVSGRCEGSCSGNCEVRSPSFACEGTCSGSCTIEGAATCGGTCSGTCNGGCTVEISGGCDGTCTGKCDGQSIDGQCDGQCEGTCTTDITAECTGTCEGSCSESCTVNGTAECTGTCNGVCEFTPAEGNCEGSCKGECHIDANVDGTCEGGSPPRCEGRCEGTCSAECAGEVTPPSCSADCEATVDCQASAKAEASASLECSPPSLEIGFNLKAGLDAKAKAEFLVKMDQFKVRMIGIIRSMVQLRALVEGDASIGLEPPVATLYTSLQALIEPLTRGELSFDIPVFRINCALDAAEDALSFLNPTASDGLVMSSAGTIKNQFKLVSVIDLM